MQEMELSTDTAVSDFFTGYNSNLWKREIGLNCLGQECFFSKPDNLEYFVPEFDIPHSYLRIQLRNSCKGKKCCYHDKFCTNFVGGQITSRKLFPFGSFRFLAKADVTIGSRSGIEASYSCFSIAAGLNIASHPDGERKDIRWSASICISNIDAWEANLIYEFGPESRITPINLSFNPRKHIALYRMDWEPNVVRFYIKDKLVGQVKRKEGVYVPKRHVYMTACVIPENMTKISRIQENEVSLFLFRAHYLKWEPGAHQELKVRVLSCDSCYLLLGLLFIAAVCAATLVCYYWGVKLDESHLSGYYVPLQDSVYESVINTNFK